MIRNSTIQPKKKQLLCGHFNYAFSKGRCRSCATIEDFKKNFSYNRESKEVDNNLFVWYGNRIKYAKRICENCGSDLSNYSTKDFHASIAHILPKSLFPSIATNKYNYLILGIWCGCHSNYDSSWLKASKMDVFSIAKERFPLFRWGINQEEIRRIPSIFF